MTWALIPSGRSGMSRPPPIIVSVGDESGVAMIWAILVFLGIPLWLIALALFTLIRTRSRIGSIPGSVRCKVRSSAPIPGMHDEYTRYTSTAYWVHDVLIVHGGTFLIQTLPLGVARCSAGPQPAEANPRIKKLDSPVTVRLTLDSGADVELACDAADATRLLGPFAP